MSSSESAGASTDQTQSPSTEPQPITFQRAYAVTNLLLLLVYPLMRYQALQLDWSSRYTRVTATSELQTLEMQGAFGVLVLIVWQTLWRRSIGTAFQHSVFYAKAVTSLAAFALDARLGVWYMLLWAVSHLMLPRPLHQLAAPGNIKSLPADYLVEIATTSTDLTWLVYFYAEKHDTSYTVADAFKEAADKYSSPKLCFGAYDACFWPGSAKDLKVDVNHLPCVVAYQGGKEVRRLPTQQEVDDNILMKRIVFSTKDIVRRFELEKFEAKGSIPLSSTEAEKRKSKQKA